MIATRYPELEPKAIVSKLLGSDIDTDDHEDDESVGVTGKQGGRLLACYLFSVKDDMRRSPSSRRASRRGWRRSCPSMP